MNLRAISLVVLPVIALFSLPGCSPGGEAVATRDAEPVIVRRGNGEDPGTLDPARAEGVHAFNVIDDLYEGLLARDAAGNVIAGVAGSWTVSDDGIGIPESEVEKLFTEFYRATNARASGREGTGLGLSLVKEILERAHSLRCLLLDHFKQEISFHINY